MHTEYMHLEVLPFVSVERERERGRENHRQRSHLNAIAPLLVISSSWNPATYSIGMASAYSGQTALCHLSAPSPTSNDGGGSRTSSAEAAGVLTASTTLDSYVPPKCLWSSARAGGGGGIVVYKVSSVRADLCAIQFVACMLLLCCDVLSGPSLTNKMTTVNTIPQ